VILQADPKAQYLSHQGEIDEAIRRVLQGGRYILGAEVQSFEAEFAAYSGCRHGIGVGSGTEAISLALRAVGIGPGDEVITTAHTAVATVAAIEMCGATPVLVDIEPDYYTMDPAKAQAAVTSRTRAIIPVHLYGQPADLSRLGELAKTCGLALIEDCAQAHGAFWQGRRVGSWGQVACFSFYPTKNLGALGDGGMAVTDSPQIAERLRLLREYGWRQRYISEIPGGNSRLDELQAAALRVKLRYLDADNQRRAALAARYAAKLAGASVCLPASRMGAQHVYNLYGIRSKRRDALQAFLKKNDVGTLIHYPMPIHLQPAYYGRLGREGSFPETERVSREILSLPMYPEMTDDQLDTICTLIRDFDKT
jgi:dTDP-4-amino-4,6-dideoxygalactose transaminase